MPSLNIRGDDSCSRPCRCLGQPHLPPLLLLHGFLGSSLDWLSIADHLSGRFFCLLPDLPGHGRHPPQDPFNFDTVVDDLAHLLTDRKVTPVNVVGYSMGGRLALYFALKYPASVQRLVLEGAGPGLSDSTERAARAALDDQRAEELCRHGIDKFIEKWYQAPLFTSLTRQPEVLAHVKQARKKNRGGWVAAAIRALSPGRQPNLWPRLNELKMPVLAVGRRVRCKVCQLMPTDRKTGSALTNFNRA